MQDELFDAAVCNAKQCIESTVNIPVAIRHQFILQCVSGADANTVIIM